MLKENPIILRNIHGFSQEGIALIPAEIFEAKLKQAMDFASANSDQ